MTDKELKLPFFAKASIFFIGLFALLMMMYIGKGIIIPLVLAIILSILLHPVVNFFVRFKINRLIAIIITLFLTFLIIFSFGALLFSHAKHFSESLPLLVDKFTCILNQAITDSSGYLNINPHIIHDWITKAKGELINTSSVAIKNTIVSIGSGAIVLFLIPLYIFMILFYHPLILEFIRRLFAERHQNQLSLVIKQIKTVIQSYLKGLIIEASIVATLYTVALLILGIEYAVLLGIISAVLNVIPYAGVMAAVSLSMIVALATRSSAWYALYVLGAYFIIHLIDYNYIIPRIVASKVKINALFSIIVIISGNALWGIPGMFLSIPLLAIIKLVFDNIEPLKPWGYLLGDTMPPVLKIKPLFKKIKKKTI